MSAFAADASCFLFVLIHLIITVVLVVVVVVVVVIVVKVVVTFAAGYLSKLSLQVCELGCYVSE